MFSVVLTCKSVWEWSLKLNFYLRERKLQLAVHICVSVWSIKTSSKDLIYLLFYLPCFLRIVHDVFWSFFRFSDPQASISFLWTFEFAPKKRTFWEEQRLLCRPKLLTDGSLSSGLLVQMMVAVVESSKELLNLKKSKGNLGKFSFSKSLDEMDFFLKSGTKG